MMERSRSQVLFTYLPGAVFRHDDEFIGRVVEVRGRSADTDVNRKILLDRVEQAVLQWDPEERLIPLPSQAGVENFDILVPELVRWEIWPLVFQCSNQGCLRVRRFYNQKAANEYSQKHKGLKCEDCGWKLSQIRYFTAHNCGHIQDLFTPTCNSCGQRTGVYFDDTGAFSSSVWRCRNCRGNYIQGQRFTPCGCRKYLKGNKKVSYQRAMTIKDRQAYYSHQVALVNLRGTHYETLLTHPRRGEAAISSLLGDETNLAVLLQKLDQGQSSGRLSASEWEEQENKYLSMGLPAEDIALLRRERGPSDTGLDRTLADVPEDLFGVGEDQGLLERAALWGEVSDRRTLGEAISDANEMSEREALRAAASALERLGISELSVTMSFPIALAAFGYTRGSGSPKNSTLRSFDRKGTSETGNTPIFVTAVNTEALVVELSPVAVLRWLHSNGWVVAPPPDTRREAQIELLRQFDQQTDASDKARTLVHSMSHLLLRTLDDGQSGFGESSLAEWVVPEALTFATYVSSYKAVPIGAFWTLLHSRAEAWATSAISNIFRCDNDPLCHHRRPMACERCMYLTFGCSDFNDDLSREDLMDFARFLGGPA